MKFRKMLCGTLGLLAIVSLAACGGGDSKSESKADSAKDLAKEARVEKASIEVYVPQGKNTDYLKNRLSFITRSIALN